MALAFRTCVAVYWLALVIWVSVLISAGVAAMSAFTVLPEDSLGLTLDQFSAYDLDHGRIAAGKVLEPIFTFVDVVQVAAGSIALITLILMFTLFGRAYGQEWKRPANLVRVLALLLAAGLFLVRAITVTPEMNRDLQAYWQAAEAGEVERAAALRESFDALHRRARPLFDGSLLALLVAVGASGVATLPRRFGDRAPTSELDAPALLNKPRP
ncbi:MAG: hypothetical protein EA377_12860 [Phycisphaerales bacterium]|nr:MAG: hypothetical protein EA377_12860 [Phycisphaerales bacterium]